MLRGLEGFRSRGVLPFGHMNDADVVLAGRGACRQELALRQIVAPRSGIGERQVVSSGLQIGVRGDRRPAFGDCLFDLSFKKREVAEVISNVGGARVQRAGALVGAARFAAAPEGSENGPERVV